VRVQYDEGVANRIGPEPCVCVREGAGEASAGVRIGQPSSRESFVVPGADAFDPAEGDTGARANASAPRPGEV
jgi:hypothetical protein